VLIDTVIRGDRNMIRKEVEKILKYSYKEMRRMWNVKPKLMPVMRGATGTVSKSLRQYLSNIPGEHEIKEIQKNSHIGRCTCTEGSTNGKVRKFNMGNNFTYSANCKYSTAATVYSANCKYSTAATVYSANCKYSTAATVYSANCKYSTAATVYSANCKYSTAATVYSLET
jgi:hypothetical protein